MCYIYGELVITICFRRNVPSSGTKLRNIQLVFLMAQHTVVGQCLFIIDASRSHTDTPHCVGLLWTSDQPDAESSDNTQCNTHNKQISMLPAGFEPAVPTSERPQTQDLDGAAKLISNIAISKEESLHCSLLLFNEISLYEIGSAHRT